MDKEFIPKSCDECIKSKYKRPEPYCAHEQGIKHKKTYLFFKNNYGVEIQQHLDEMQKLLPKKEQCLHEIQQQAREMITLRSGLGIDKIFSSISKLNDRVNDIESNDLSDETRDRILASPERSSDEEQTTRTVIPKKKKQQPEHKPQKEKPKKKLSMAERGWLTYIRNCKKENVKKYVEKLKEEHPNLPDDQIDIGINGSGNRMIRYTLNPDLVKE